MKKKITNKIFIKLFALAIAASMILCASACFGNVDGGAIPGTQSGKTDVFPELTFIDELFRANTLFELDDEALLNAVLKGYVDGTGDKYAEYFTEEEYKALTSENKGETVGVGISVVQNTEKNCIEIINVVQGSPAMEAGVLPGDLIIYIGTGDNKASVAEEGFTMALDLLRGVEGSIAEFTVLRDGEEIEFSIERKKVSVVAVNYHVYIPEGGKKVGIVKMTEFDLTTPTAFENAVDSLISDGCEYFIFDVRNNPGGDLNSIIAVLAYFLDEGDTVIRTSDRKGNKTERKIAAVKYGGDYTGCSISKEDIGKYKNLNCAVMTNENTASAAELFSAALKDHEVSFTVGTQTYGKGTMQSILRLDSYGYKGALKLTTQFYYPPISDSYEGIGVAPDIVVELAEELKGKNMYLIEDSEDNQLAAAIKALSERNK